MYRHSLLLILIVAVKSDDNFSSTIDVDSLSLLPLDGLLTLKKNLLVLNGIQTNLSLDSPQALPLLSSQSIKSKSGYYVHYVDEDAEKGDNKSISKIFQSSVTSLAFLAFGGYLLFLIITAIKGKQMMYMDNNQIQTMINGQVHRRKKKKRRKKRPYKGQGPFGYKDDYYYSDKLSLNGFGSNRELMLDYDDIDTSKLYESFLHLCEGYRKLMD